MAKKLDPVIASVLKDFGYGPDAAWDCHGTWVVYHRVLEQIAAKADISFDPPQPLEVNGSAKSVAICVTGRKGAKAEWSIGEAAPGNNKNAYPYAMAEKRAKDRVILKLIGLHGLAYSEDEADDFKAPATAPQASTQAKQAHAPVPQQPSQEPAPAAKSRAQIAKEWAEKQIPKIATMTKTELDAFTLKFRAQIADLPNLDKAAGMALDKAVADRLEELFA